MKINSIKKTHCWNLGKAKYFKKKNHKGLKYFNDTLITPYDDKTQTKEQKITLTWLTSTFEIKNRFFRFFLP